MIIILILLIDLVKFNSEDIDNQNAHNTEIIIKLVYNIISPLLVYYIVYNS